MKLIHLKNLKRECVLVELPEGAKNIRIGDWGNFVYDSPRAGEFAIDTLVPLDHRKFLGKFTDLTEDQFGELVYIEYHRDASESFISSIEAEGYTLTNQVGIYQAKNTSESEKLKQIDSQMVWQAAQKKVINLSNCYLFVKS